MHPHLMQIIAIERQHDLERAAGCCTPLAEHRRAVRRPSPRNRVRSLIAAAHPALGSEPSACCA
jgi:hypothetical protein